MKKALFIDAVGMLDTDLLEEYVRKDQSLRSMPVRKTKWKRYLTALLAATLAMLLCVALLVTSLPLIYVFNAEKINAAVSERMESVLFPLDREDGEVDKEDLAFNWVELPIADEMFDALGAGTDDSVIAQLQSMNGDGFISESMHSLGDLLQRMYEYYLKYRDDDTAVDQETTETETEEQTTEEETKPEENEQIPYAFEQDGVSYELDLANNTWRIIKIEGMRELMDSAGVLIIPEQRYGLPVTEIARYAAEGNTMIQELVLPNSMTTIGVSAFEECSNLKKITWGEGVKRIEMLAFARCGITSLELPQSVKSVGDHAFTECTSLKTVKLPTSMKTVQEHCFSGCTALVQVIIPEGYTTFYDGAFAGCTALKSIELPQSLRVLDVSAFARSGLEYAEIPEGIETVERTVFKDCKSLKSIYLPDAMETIPEGFFSGCSSLTEIRFPSACKSIGEEAFSYCTALENLDMPDTVGAIRKRAFYGCTGLVQVEFSEKLASIQIEAFMNCTSLQSVILPEGFTDLGGSVFSGCFSLTEVYIPSTLRFLRGYAFTGCSALEEIDIPETVQYVEEGVFMNCRSLKRVSLPAFSDSSTITNFMFKGCTQLSEVSFGEGFDDGDFGNRMFENTGLTHVVIPQNVTVIDEYAYYDCAKLETVVLHADVQQIMQKAFANCKVLDQITYQGTTADFASKVSVEQNAIPTGVRIVCTDGEIVIE